MYRILVSAGIVLALSVSVVVSSVHGQGKGKPQPANVLVTSTVENFANAGSGPAFDLKSDQSLAGQYSSGAGILSEIYDGSGDWVLDLTDQSVRKVDLTFRPAATPLGTVPTDGLYAARVLSRCFTGDDITGLLAIAPGNSNATCSLRVVFTYGGTQHVLVSSPMYAGTTPTNVSCVEAATDGSCRRWTILPGNGFDSRAALYRIAKNGRETLIGDFYLAFSIGATRP